MKAFEVLPIASGAAAVHCPPCALFMRHAAGHGDLIHDIQYNYYGNKLATCSSDQSIKARLAARAAVLL